MPKFLRKVVFVLVAIFILDVIISIWILVHDLKTRYPDLDFSKAQFGIASWYSRQDKNINKHTANGEVFDDTKMTCASWEYPFGQKLIVINSFTGKWGVCRVNDRGPNKRLNREIDLTRSAFKKIANLRRGLIYVTVIPAEAKKTS